MSYVALEVSINGEHKYTVGAEEWRTIWAQVFGHHVTPAMFPAEALPPGQEIPEVGVTTLNFMASVSIPLDEIDSNRSTSERNGKSLQAGCYPSTPLTVGDVLTIKVVDSDGADEPEWRSGDPTRIGLSKVVT